MFVSGRVILIWLLYSLISGGEKVCVYVTVVGSSGWLFGVSGPASACRDPRQRSSIVSSVSRVLCRFFFIFFVAPKILFFFYVVIFFD